MDALMLAAQLLLSLTLLVFIHELGHFLAAKAFGIKVEKFYIFFDAYGKKLFSFTRGETEYGIGWLPLGGYVKISGMIDESMDTEQMASEPQDWEFRSKPAWQRFIVMIGGIVMNIILGVIVYSGWLYHFKAEYLPAAELNKTGIYAHEMAQEVGLKTGDRILKVNGSTPERFDDIKSVRLFFGGNLVVDRNGEEVSVDLPGNLFKRIKEPFISPRYQDLFVKELAEDAPIYQAGVRLQDQLVAVDGQGFDNIYEYQQALNGKELSEVNLTFLRGADTVAVAAQLDSFAMIDPSLKFSKDQLMAAHYSMADYTIGKSFVFGSKEAFNAIAINALGLAKIFTGEVEARKSVSSPIGIAKLFDPSWDWSVFWFITALISMVLAFMNFLPIPALDGGHIVFLLIEMVIGRPVNQKFQEKAQMVGMVLLLGLMIFAVGNDIINLV